MSASDYVQMFKQMVTDRKEATFPPSLRPSKTNGETAPDWDLEIGGLKEVKTQVEDMFGITQ